MAFLVATTSLPAVYRRKGYARTTTAGTPHARANYQWRVKDIYGRSVIKLWRYFQGSVKIIVEATGMCGSVMEVARKVSGSVEKVFWRFQAGIKEVPCNCWKSVKKNWEWTVPSSAKNAFGQVKFGFKLACDIHLVNQFWFLNYEDPTLNGWIVQEL